MQFKYSFVLHFIILLWDRILCVTHAMIIHSDVVAENFSASNELEAVAKGRLGDTYFPVQYLL